MHIPLRSIEWGSHGGGDRPIRTKRPPRKVQKMHKFIKAGGVLPPIIVFVDIDGFVLMEGHHRIYVHLDNESPTILAKICKDSDEGYKEIALEWEARKVALCL